MWTLGSSISINTVQGQHWQNYRGPQHQRLGVSVVATRAIGILNGEGCCSHFAPWEGGSQPSHGDPHCCQASWPAVWGDAGKMLPALSVLRFVAAASSLYSRALSQHYFHPWVVVR